MDRRHLRRQDQTVPPTALTRLSGPSLPTTQQTRPDDTGAPNHRRPGTLGSAHVRHERGNHRLVILDA